MATYVIVHGAWGGGWSWNRRVAARLRAAGHNRQYSATDDTVRILMEHA